MPQHQPQPQTQPTTSAPQAAPTGGGAATGGAHSAAGLSYAGGAAAVAPPPEPRGGGRRVKVQRGDTLWGIAAREMGDGGRWPQLWAVNRAAVPRKDALAIGTLLVIPPEWDSGGAVGATPGDARAGANAGTGAATTAAAGPAGATTATAGAEAAPPVQLRGDALAAAIRFYERNGGQYRNHVVRKIQDAVGVGVDGVLGGDTIRAIAGWQKTRGLPVDGIAGPATLAAMFGRDIRRDPVPRVATAPEGQLLSTQALWVAHDWVKRHRSQYTPPVLRELEGLLGRPQDGVVDSELIRAVAMWQRDHALQADGIPGPATLQAMFGRDIRMGQGPAPAADAEGDVAAGSGGLDRPHGLAAMRRVFGEPGSGITSKAMRAGPGGAMLSVPCHRKIADKLAQVFEDVHKDGMSEHIKTYDGCYVYRRKRSSTGSWSTHAWGIAIDVNAAWNPMVSKKSRMKVSEGQHVLLPYFERHGFYWGGHFNDPMHFQYCTGY